MRRATRLVALSTVLFLLASPLAQPCGDKLLSISRGIRLQNAYKTRHPASILIYVGQATAGAVTKNGKAGDPLIQLSILYMSLRQAGHKLVAVGNLADLDETLAMGPVDFVLAELPDMGIVVKHASAARSRPTVLPMMYRPSRADFAAAQKQFKFALKMPAVSVQHLETIDQAMKSRTRAVAGA